MGVVLMVSKFVWYKGRKISSMATTSVSCREDGVFKLLMPCFIFSLPVVVLQPLKAIKAL